MIDLETRDRVYTWKEGEITLGGTGKGLDTPAIDARFDSSPAPTINTAGMSIVDFRREQAIEKKGSENAYWKYYYAKHTDKRHTADTQNFYAQLGYDNNIVLPDANGAAPRTGLTQGLFNAVDPNQAHTTNTTDNAGH